MERENLLVDAKGEATSGSSTTRRSSAAFLVLPRGSWRVAPEHCTAATGKYTRSAGNPRRGAERQARYDELVASARHPQVGTLLGSASLGERSASMNSASHTVGMSGSVHLHNLSW
jgi:hypothetical protein